MAASFIVKVPVGIGGDVDRAFREGGVRQLLTGLGVKSVLGRVFVAADEVEPVAVISHDYWRRRFNESEKAVGQAVTIDGVLSRSSESPLWGSREKPRGNRPICGLPWHSGHAR